MFSFCSFSIQFVFEKIYSQSSSEQGRSLSSNDKELTSLSEQEGRGKGDKSVSWVKMFDSYKDMFQIPAFVTIRVPMLGDRACLRNCSELCVTDEMFKGFSVQNHWRIMESDNFNTSVILTTAESVVADLVSCAPRVRCKDLKDFEFLSRFELLDGYCFLPAGQDVGPI
ncbi:hypothetical protein NE237_007859 [Protea cynaroides]|uniref:Uncharacterized protein n=1 Tax=Protea cynaroides TaxID=273540 RepID=A0A9Q0QWV5_9MAGN|nr:hypothetical protein NE237_007859 [Protea cynaroides]